MVNKDKYIKCLLLSAIVLLGEPKRWESALQILVDVLRSDGRPNQVPAESSWRQLPVVACNMDLQFQHSAPMPRWGCARH